MHNLIVDVILSGRIVDSFAVAVDTPDASAAEAPAIDKARFVVRSVPE